MGKVKTQKLIPNTTVGNNTTIQYHAEAQEVSQSISEKPFMNLTQVSITVVQIIVSLLKIVNSFLMLITYILLVFQTIYILNQKQPKYINLRHLALKWIACILFHEISKGFSNVNNVNSQLITIMLNLLIIGIAYPSRAIKAVHLKYFSHKQQQRYHESVSDPNKYDITFVSKIIIAIIVGLLKLCKYFIAFVLPSHRRQIQEALRGVNSVVIDRKCFWSIYKDQKQQLPLKQKDKQALKQYLIAGSTVITPRNDQLYNSGNTFENPNAANVNLKQGKQVIKAYGEKCSNITSNGYKPVKRVSIKYYINQSKLQLLDLDFGKLQTYILQELTQKQGNVLQLKVLSSSQKFSECIYIKFKNYRQLQSIQESTNAF